MRKIYLSAKYFFAVVQRIITFYYIFKVSMCAVIGQFYGTGTYLVPEMTCTSQSNRDIA